MPTDDETSDPSELHELVVAFDASESEEEDARTMGAIRALALRDPPAFVDALLSLATTFQMSDALEALVCLEPFDPALLPIVDAYADALDRRLRDHPDASSTEAYHAALAYQVLGELTPDRVPAPLCGQLRERVTTLLAHRHPEARSVGVRLCVDLRNPSRFGCLDAVIEVLRRDPDPVVRDLAFRELEQLGALPPDASRPFRPTWFRSIRRALAGG